VRCTPACGRFRRPRQVPATVPASTMRQARWRRPIFPVGTRLRAGRKCSHRIPADRSGTDYSFGGSSRGSKTPITTEPRFAHLRLFHAASVRIVRRHGEIRGQSVRSRLGQLPGPTLQTPFETDRVQSVGISEGLSRVSWKLSRTVLRGGAASNGGSLLDKKTAIGKQPYAIALADRGLMALAGLLENWHSPAGEWVRSFAIVTTTPNELCGSCTIGCRLC
jgi:hypothetical protein